ETIVLPAAGLVLTGGGQQLRTEEIGQVRCGLTRGLGTGAQIRAQRRRGLGGGGDEPVEAAAGCRQCASLFDDFLDLEPGGDPAVLPRQRQGLLVAGQRGRNRGQGGRDGLPVRDRRGRHQVEGVAGLLQRGLDDI